MNVLNFQDIVSAPFMAFTRTANGMEEWFVKIGASTFWIYRAGTGELQIHRVKEIPGDVGRANPWHEVPHRLGREFFAFISQDERDLIREANADTKKLVRDRCDWPPHLDDVLRSLDNVERDLAAGVSDVEE
ncbi:MAG: hypothetical protein IT290_06810 [Deltaproteobacteria bacterium]|nr:hypothetical protein [Deltaproteobacteria bacterium]